jgi:mannose-6-phosphate isomerase
MVATLNMPLRFVPQFKSMLWGGTRLPQFLGRADPLIGPLGEAWVLSDVPGSVSVVASGPHAGESLTTLCQRFGQDLFGTQYPADGRFPLLLKFIDAQQELSVQVHPNDAQAKARHGEQARGKTEAWVILEAEPESKIYAGFAPGTTAAQFEQALHDGTAAKYLATYTPKPGECYFLEAGTVHAIGAKILLFEVQQTSDITYRLYDWGRVDAKTGLPRQLHITEGLACSAFDRVVKQPEPDATKLAACQYFSLLRHHIDTTTVWKTNGLCQVIVVVAGAGRLGEEELNPGTVLLLPAAITDTALSVTHPLTLLECRLGDV